MPSGRSRIDVSGMYAWVTTRFVTGPMLVAEACYRRLTTPRGMLRGGEDEANYGLDLTELVGGTNPKAVSASLQGRIASELRKDERVESVEVDVFVETAPNSMVSYTITIDVVTGAGPFTLQILASTVTVALLGIS